MYQSARSTDPNDLYSSRCRKGDQAHIRRWSGTGRHRRETCRPGDLAVQARQVFANLGRALAAAGAFPEQVAKITIYVVDYERDRHLAIIEAGRPPGHRLACREDRRRRRGLWPAPAHPARMAGFVGQHSRRHRNSHCSSQDPALRRIPVLQADGGLNMSTLPFSGSICFANTLRNWRTTNRS
nr:RidA family protein [Mesorhizobium sp.]